MKRRVIWIVIVILIAGAANATYFGIKVFGNINHSGKPVQIRIRSGWSLQQLADSLKTPLGMSESESRSFASWSQRFGYETVKPCFLEIPARCNIKQLTNLLKANRNQTRNITIRGSFDGAALVSAIGSVTEVNADTLQQLLTRPGNNRYGFNDTTWPAFFLPNTYNVFVADNLDKVMQRMKKEYDAFWNQARLQKAEKQGLTPYEVMTIASILTKESNKTDEYQNIAGVYMNRLRRGMLLQADPTVVFVRKKGGRVLGADLMLKSPYNTYLHKGLPPGPICIPNLAAIEAVLSYGHHDYLFFCAKADFSGYHSFAATFAEHKRNADAFHAALDRRNIK